MRSPICFVTSLGSARTASGPMRITLTGCVPGTSVSPGPPSASIFMPWPGPAKPSNGAQAPSSATTPPWPRTAFGPTGSPSAVAPSKAT